MCKATVQVAASAEGCRVHVGVRGGAGTHGAQRRGEEHGCVTSGVGGWRPALAPARGSAIAAHLQPRTLPLCRYPRGIGVHPGWVSFLPRPPQPGSTHGCPAPQQTEVGAPGTQPRWRAESSSWWQSPRQHVPPPAPRGHSRARGHPTGRGAARRARARPEPTNEVLLSCQSGTKILNCCSLSEGDTSAGGKGQGGGSLPTPQPPESEGKGKAGGGPWAKEGEELSWRGTGTLRASYKVHRCVCVCPHVEGQA